MLKTDIPAEKKIQEICRAALYRRVGPPKAPEPFYSASRYHFQISQRRFPMSDLNLKNPKTPEEIRKRNAKIRHYAFDMFTPVLAALFFVLAILWPQTIFSCLAGGLMGIVLIRFSTSRYRNETEKSIGDKVAMAAGIVLILLAVFRLAFLILEDVGVLSWPFV